MRMEFAREVLSSELQSGRLDRSMSVLGVCSGESDRSLLDGLGFTNLTLTNLDVRDGSTPDIESGEEISRSDGRWEQADAQDLPYADRSFDLVFVSDGLHHCRVPHQAVTEMYRVAARGIIVVESRDSLSLRLASRVGLSAEYEFNRRLLATREQGGVDFGPVPNFVFRWTERDFERVIRTYNPENDVEVAYYYGLHLPRRLESKPGVSLLAHALARVAPRQGNTFAMAAYRSSLKPYLTENATRHKVQLTSDVSGPAAQRGHSPVRRHRKRIAARPSAEAHPSAHG